MTNPYFELVMKKEGADIKFVFLPGNVDEKIFQNTCNYLYQHFHAAYGISTSAYIEKVNENGISTLAIKDKKVIPFINGILTSPAYSGFKIKVTGVDKSGNVKTVIVNKPTESTNAAAAVPYINKNNNDMTTRRRK